MKNGRHGVNVQRHVGWWELNKGPGAVIMFWWAYWHFPTSAPWLEKNPFFWFGACTQPAATMTSTFLGKYYVHFPRFHLLPKTIAYSISLHVFLLILYGIKM